MTKHEPLERSDTFMSRYLFNELLALTLQQPWLSKRSNQLYDLMKVCSSEEERGLLSDLISRVNYLSPMDHANAIEEVARQIDSEWKLKSDQTCIVSLSNGEFADSSNAISWYLKGQLAEAGEWKTHNFRGQLGTAVDSLDDNGSLVIVDEFCGTGDSVLKKIHWINNRLKKTSKQIDIYVAVTAAMKIGARNVTPHVKDFFTPKLMDRGISDYWTGADLATNLMTMKYIEDGLEEKSGKKSLSQYRLGYKKSESLYYLEGGNPPNNNFPIFWWEKHSRSNEWKPMLRRI